MAQIAAGKFAQRYRTVLVQNSKPIDLRPADPHDGRGCRAGSTFVLVIVAMVALMTLGLGMLTVAWGARHRAIMLKSEAVAMLAAEAGYEKAVYWMGQQPDMLSALMHDVSGTTGSLSFSDSHCNYRVTLHTFLKHRPVYRVVSQGHSGLFSRTVDVYIVQAISGWDMGMCRVASGTTSTYPVNFAGGEIVDIPVHINKQDDSPDKTDIYITGKPRFLQLVTMGEPRYTAGGVDKYPSVMDTFEGGIYFSQPNSRVTDEQAVAVKMGRFEDTTKAEFQFEPVATAPLDNPNAAVQIEFFLDDLETGKVAITNNCTVRGFRQTSTNKTWDFKIRSGSDGKQYEQYDIYAYHVAPQVADNNSGILATDIYSIEDTYVTQSYGEYESDPGGQIFVEGNVIIGGNRARHDNDQLLKGKMMIVATGNIWIADSIVLHGPHDADGKPGEDNENVLGLIAQAVVKVVDPGMTDPDFGSVGLMPENPNGFEYVPIGRPDNPDVLKDDLDSYRRRHLPDPTVVEAAITIGGGGWGAENVRRGSDGGRKERSGRQDYLILRGALVEAMRGVVGLVNSDGYLKRYYFDERLLEGILPADVWLQGKYVPAPAGWQDYRSGGSI